MSETPLNEKQKEVIEQLTSDLKPVRVFRFLPMFFLWLVLAAVVVVSALFFIGPRADLTQKLSEPFYLVSAIVIFLTWIASAYFSFKMSVPGEIKKEKLTIFLVLVPLFLSLSLLMFSQDFSDFSHHLDHGSACFIATLKVSFLPWLILIVLLSRLASLSPVWTALLASTSALFMGMLVLHLHCMDDHMWHLLIWHYIPVFIISFLLAWPLSKLLRLWRKKT